MTEIQDTFDDILVKVNFDEIDIAYSPIDDDNQRDETEELFGVALALTNDEIEIRSTIRNRNLARRRWHPSLECVGARVRDSCQGSSSFPPPHGWTQPPAFLTWGGTSH